MCKVIEVKEELRGLKFDVEQAQIAGRDPELILETVMKKINNVFFLDQKEYLKVVWKK